MIDGLQQLISGNELLSGGAALMILGGLLAYLRNVPKALWAGLLRWLTLEIDIHEKDISYRWVSRLLAEQEYGRDRARLLTVKTYSKGDGRGYHVGLSPGVGRHFMKYRGTAMIVTRIRTEGSSAGLMDASSTLQSERLSIRMLSRDRSLAYKLIEDARQLCEGGDSRSIPLFMKNPWRPEWNLQGHRLKRPAESVVLEEGVMESVAGDIREFFGAQQFYAQTGIPYRRSYLLSGPPGNGKSSLVTALCSEFDLSLCILSLTGGDNWTDDQLTLLLATAPPRAAVLIEDIDSSLPEKGKGITMAGLLNAICGAAASEGRLLFMTTNHPERLDPRLLRPGRTDMHIRLGNASRSQAERLCERLNGHLPVKDALEGLDFAAGVSMAEVQGRMLSLRSGGQRHDQE